MPRPPTPDPLDAPVPAYGTGSLCDLLPAIAAGLGLRSTTSSPLPKTTLRLPTAPRACVFLIDGLGHHQLREHAPYAPFLASLTDTTTPTTAPTLTAGFPATTATSLASFGTGLPPGRHGLAGYTVAVPGRNTLMNQLCWEPWTEPTTWQPHPPLLRTLHERGIHIAQVLPTRFATTPLTRIALSGGRFIPEDDADRRMDRAAAELALADRTLVYTYLSDLDAAGHTFGVNSDEWRDQLMRADRLAQRLANRLPPRSALYITSDHGMVDVPHHHRFDFDHDGELNAGVALLGGEARARHIYAQQGAASDVHAAWQERLGDHMWIATREEAIKAGWFGPVMEDRVRPRIGDVIAVARTETAVIATRTEPGASTMTGLHGAMTPAELLVPLLQVQT
ncbi:nucleotide pyrophosphatase/phosphodiesterase family protein [Streptomyces sp. NPDC018352]|uniref:alkaline phosphatase family protein n=1 Tax=Streptomyces sp. NPDC018352 TaxID=3157194 RepID=UPI0033F480D3